LLTCALLALNAMRVARYRRQARESWRKRLSNFRAGRRHALYLLTRAAA